MCLSSRSSLKAAALRAGFALQLRLLRVVRRRRRLTSSRQIWRERSTEFFTIRDSVGGRIRLPRGTRFRSGPRIRCAAATLQDGGESGVGEAPSIVRSIVHTSRLRRVHGGARSRLLAQTMRRRRAALGAPPRAAHSLPPEEPCAAQYAKCGMGTSGQAYRSCAVATRSGSVVDSEYHSMCIPNTSPSPPGAPPPPLAAGALHRLRDLGRPDPRERRAIPHQGRELVRVRVEGRRARRPRLPATRQPPAVSRGQHVQRRPPPLRSQPRRRVVRHDADPHQLVRKLRPARPLAPRARRRGDRPRGAPQPLDHARRPPPHDE